MGPAKSYHVIARRAKPDVAIRILSGAKHRQPPHRGTERERIATPLRARNDVVTLGWSCCFFCGDNRWDVGNLDPIA